MRRRLTLHAYRGNQLPAGVMLSKGLPLKRSYEVSVDNQNNRAGHRAAEAIARKKKK